MSNYWFGSLSEHFALSLSLLVLVQVCVESGRPRVGVDVHSLPLLFLLVGQQTCGGTALLNLGTCFQLMAE